MFNDGGVPNGTHTFVEADDTGYGEPCGVKAEPGGRLELDLLRHQQAVRLSPRGSGCRDRGRGEDGTTATEVGK